MKSVKVKDINLICLTRAITLITVWWWWLRN